MKASPPPAPEPTPAEPQPAVAAPPETPPAATTPAPDPSTQAAWPHWFRAVDVAVALLVVVAAFFVASHAARNSDVWPHLAAGRLIAEGKYQFGTDPFSYATEGRTWINHAWLIDLVAYLIYKADPTGAALVAVKAVAFAVAVGLVMLIRRPGHSLWPWAVFAALAVVAAAPHTGLRPLLFSAVLLAATLFVLLGTEWQRGSWRSPLILTGLFWVWANVDGWFVLGPLTVALVLLGEWLHRMLLAGGGEAASSDDPFRPPAPLPDLAKALGLGVVACMLNPHHVGVWQLPSELGVGLPTAVTSDAVFSQLVLGPLSKLYSEDSRFGNNLNGLAYLLLVALGGLALLAGFSRLRLSHLLIWLGFAFLSLLHYRLILFFALAAVPVASACVNGLSTRIRLGSKTQPATRIALTLSGIGRILSVPAVLVLIAAAWPGWLHPRTSDPAQVARVAWAVRPDPGHTRTAEMLQRWRNDGRLPDAYRGLTLSLELGNYIAWFAPAEKVLLNGRSTFHGPELEDLIKARKSFRLPENETDEIDFASIRDAAAKYGTTYVLYTDGGSSSRGIDQNPVLNLVYNTREWKLWHIDGRVAVFGSRGGQQSAPDSFDRLTFDPLRLAFDPGQEPLPELPLTHPPDRTREWWEEFEYAPSPTPLATLDAQVWAELAGVVRQQQRVPFQIAWAPVSMAVGGVLTVTPFVAENRAPNPPAADAALALQMLAVRAARQAVAVNPDHPDAYFVLALAAANRDLALPGQDPQGQLVVQVTAFRQYLERCPLPENATPDAARRALGASSSLAELYRNPALTLDLFERGAVPMLDLAREETIRAGQYAGQLAQFLRDPEQRKRMLEERDKMKARADDEYTRLNDRYEAHVRATNPKPREQIGALIQLGLVGKAIQVFRELPPTEFGPDGFFFALQVVGLKLRAGHVAEVAEDIAILEGKIKDELAASSRPSPELAEVTARLRAIQDELWRVTGNFSRLGQSMETGFQRSQLTGDERAKQLVRQATTSPAQWVGLHRGGAYGGLFGSLAGGLAGIAGNQYAVTRLDEWLREANFYMSRGLVSLFAGDIPDAQRRFNQALSPQGIEVPPFLATRALADRYLRMMGQAEAPKK